MKSLSIKLKITLWFTIFMILLCAAVFAFVAAVSSSTTTHQQENDLTALVDKNAKEIEYDDDLLEIDDDFVSFRNGMYCLVFYEGGVKISGYAPYAELENESFINGGIRSITIADEEYLVYDKLVSFNRYEDIWVRGVVMAGGGAATSTAVHQAIWFALPLLIVSASAGGYLIARRSLRPIRRISETAEKIGRSGDLSRRIEMDGSGDELNQLAGVFNRMFAQLEGNFEAERSFTSDASHELRTPVATILAQCEYAFENAHGEQELYEAIGAIQKQGYRMSRLIESLLNVTRLEQHTETFAWGTVCLSEIARSVCREQKEAGIKNITLTETIQPDVSIKADPALVAQMLGNLIQNAYRYGVENGNISVDLKQTGHEITLCVSDDGIGMAAEEIPKIWSRFYRVDKSRSASQGTGFGLGLAVVRQIVDLHGGSIRVESELSRGTSFTLTFPSA
jgi:signal transduction histidine kinase